MNMPTKFFIVCAMLGHFDDKHNLIEATPQIILATDQSKEEAIEKVKNDFFYAKKYFELISVHTKEITEDEMAKLGYHKIYEYRHLSNNDPYFVVQEDVFRKGKEKWTLDAFAPVIKVKSYE